MEISGSHVWTPQCQRGQLFSAGIQNSLRAAFTLILRVSLQDQIFFFSYRRQNPWQPIACFAGGNTEGTSKHHQGDKTRRHSRCRYCNIFVMNGEFTPFSCPVVCLHCRNLGWIYSHGCWQYQIIAFSHSLPLCPFGGQSSNHNESCTMFIIIKNKAFGKGRTHFASSARRPRAPHGDPGRESISSYSASERMASFHKM